LWFGEGRILNMSKTGVCALRAIRKF
jgi:hypothetical protein